MTTSEQQKDPISQLGEEVWEWAWNIVGFTTKDEREYNQLAQVSKEIMIEGLKKLVSDGEFVSVKELRDIIKKEAKDQADEYLAKLDDNNTNQIFIQGAIDATGKFKRKFLSKFRRR